MMQFYKGIFKNIDLIEFNQYEVSYSHDDKYFIIDLKSNYNIEFIKFNVIENIEVELFFSNDSKKWLDCCNITKNGQYEFYINIDTKNKYRFIKFNIKYCLIKEQVIQIYIRKFPGLMIAARSDGFGARLMPILNAMYLAEYTGFKFGFVWKKVAHDRTSIKQFEGNDLAGIYLSNEKYIFSQEFIDEYSYTDKLESNIRVDRKKTLMELTESMTKNWGNYIDYDTARKIFGAKIFKEYPRLWSKIKFSPRIQEVIKLSNDIVKKMLHEGFIAIHIRSGDIVFDERVRKLGVGFGKAMPVEIAMELIERSKKENKHVVLFGDDLSELRTLKQYYNVSIIEDFIQEMTGVDRIIFEINFMSKAEIIYSGGSSFARVASYIGLGKEPTFYQNIFNLNETLEIFKKQNNILKFHKLQRFYSMIHKIILQIQSDKYEYDILHDLDNAKQLDQDVSDGLCGVLSFYCILKRNNWEILEDISDKYLECSNLIFNLKYGILGRETIKLFFIHEYNFKYNKIRNFILSLKKEFFLEYYNLFKNGTLRVKNHLSYKLGMTFLNNSKTFIDYIKLPFLLFNVSRQHKKERKEFETQADIHNVSLTLPPLEECLDYKEVLKIKNELPYKIGISLIKANREWYKGGYIKFWYEIKRLKNDAIL